jgi:hypothetical protein
VQGDKEAAAGLAVSSFCNRSTMNMPKAQLNFIDIFLKVSEQLLGLYFFRGFTAPALNVSKREC